MATKIDYQQKYFDEKFSDIGDNLKDIKSLLSIVSESASNAHKRIDAWENKGWGIAIGSGLGGGGLVAFIQHLIK